MLKDDLVCCGLCIPYNSALTVRSSQNTSFPWNVCATLEALSGVWTGSEVLRADCLAAGCGLWQPALLQLKKEQLEGGCEIWLQLCVTVLEYNFNALNVNTNNTFFFFFAFSPSRIKDSCEGWPTGSTQGGCFRYFYCFYGQKKHQTMPFRGRQDGRHHDAGWKESSL